MSNQYKRIWKKKTDSTRKKEMWEKRLPVEKWAGGFLIETNELEIAAIVVV